VKTINFITPHYLPEISPCTNRVLSYINELEKHYNINVICLSEKGTYEDKLIVEQSNRVKIYYVNQKQFDGKKFITRALNEMYYIVRLVLVANKIKSDITIATTPYMFIIPLVGYFGKGKKILDIRDLVWEYLNKKSFIKKLLTLVMKKSMNKFDKIIVTNEYEKNILENEYKKKEITIIHNGIDIVKFNKLSNIKVRNNKKFTVTYVGNIGLAQNIKILVMAAEMLPNVDFKIVGDGAEMKSLENYSNKHRIKNIEFTGKLDWNELEYYYQTSSILYAQLDEKFISAVPSKLYEYASIGLPIIFGGTGIAVKLMNELENTFVIKPNSVNELVNAIDKIVSSEILISNKNKNHIEENYLRNKVVLKINKLIEDIYE